MTNQELQKIGNTILKREADNNNDGLVSKNKYNNFPWICKKKGDEVIREFMKTPEPVKPTDGTMMTTNAIQGLGNGRNLQESLLR